MIKQTLKTLATVGGIATSAVGGLLMVGAFALPVAGAIGGGIAVWGATATMGTLAQIALTAGGVIGGGLVGKIAAVPTFFFGGALLGAGVITAGAASESRAFAPADNKLGASKRLGGIFARKAPKAQTPVAKPALKHAPKAPRP